MITTADNGRRSYSRVVEKIEISITYKEKSGAEPTIVNGRVADISPTGVSFFTSRPIPVLSPLKIEFKLPEPYGTVKSRAKLSWRDDRSTHYGAQFLFNNGDRFIELEKFLGEVSRDTLSDRRQRLNSDPQGGRRTNPAAEAAEITSEDRRRMFRRISDLWGLGRGNRSNRQEIKRLRAFQRAKGLGYTHDAVRMQREWLSQQTGVELKHIAVFSEDSQQMKGNIENLVGVAQVPIGIAGPLKVNGQYAEGSYYVPMATTEGALVYTYSQGMQIVSLSGGATTTLLKDEIHISPVFGFGSVKAAKQFIQWLDSNFRRIKEEAERTTRHGKLVRVEPHIFDKHVAVKFCYTTDDAMGINMITFATDEACKFIVSTVKPEKFYVQSNFSAIKKVTAHNYITGYGKSVIAEVLIPRRLLKRIFNVTPEEVEAYFQLVLLGTVHAGMVGMTGHAANALAAIFIACGQDVPSVVESSVGVVNYEVTRKKDLYASVKLPNLIIGSVGGGMNLGTQRECLSLLGCYGSGKARKLAEIVAATVLAGEIAICARIANGTFVDGHRKYGRKNTGN